VDCSSSTPPSPGAILNAARIYQAVEKCDFEYLQINVATAQVCFSCVGPIALFASIVT